MGLLPLKTLALNYVAARARTLSQDMLRSLGARLAKQLWERIVEQSTDSLQLWLMFVETHPELLAEIPVYRCIVPFAEIASISIPVCPVALVVVLPALTRASIQAVVNLPKISSLDLSNCELSRDGIRALDQALAYGRLSDLQALCLPRVGRASDKPLFAKLQLPRSLTYLETPVRQNGWERCVARQIKPAVVLQFGLPAPRRAKAYGRKLAVPRGSSTTEVGMMS